MVERALSVREIRKIEKDIASHIGEFTTLRVAEITYRQDFGGTIRENLTRVVANLQLPENNLISWWKVLTDGKFLDCPKPPRGLVIKGLPTNLQEKLEEIRGPSNLASLTIFADGRIRWIRSYIYERRRELVWVEIPLEYYSDIAIPAFEAIKKHLEKNQTHHGILSVVGRIIENLSYLQK